MLHPDCRLLSMMWEKEDMARTTAASRTENGSTCAEKMLWQKMKIIITVSFIKGQAGAFVHFCEIVLHYVSHCKTISYYLIYNLSKAIQHRLHLVVLIRLSGCTAILYQHYSEKMTIRLVLSFSELSYIIKLFIRDIYIC